MFDFFEVYVSLVRNKRLGITYCAFDSRLLISQKGYRLKDGFSRWRLLLEDVGNQVREVIVAQSDRCFVLIYFLCIFIFVSVGFDFNFFDKFVFLFQPESFTMYILLIWSCRLSI